MDLQDLTSFFLDPESRPECPVLVQALRPSRRSDATVETWLNLAEPGEECLPELWTEQNGPERRASPFIHRTFTWPQRTLSLLVPEFARSARKSQSRAPPFSASAKIHHDRMLHIHNTGTGRLYIMVVHIK